MPPEEPITSDMAAALANTIAEQVQEEAIEEAEEGDPRRIVDDCEAISEAIGWHKETGDVSITLTRRQWDVAVATLDARGLQHWRWDDIAEAEEAWRARDGITSQIGDRLPKHHLSAASAHLELSTGLPSERSRYALYQAPTVGPTYDHHPGGGYGRLHPADHNEVAVEITAQRVSLTADLLPSPAPATGPEAWDSIAEISCLWNAWPDPALLVATPEHAGESLWEFTQDIWPHTTYRLRLSVRSTGADEKHLLQLWQAHAAPPAVLKSDR